MKGKDTIICLTFEKTIFKIYSSFDHGQSWKIDTLIQNAMLVSRPLFQLAALIKSDSQLMLSEDGCSVQVKLRYEDVRSGKTLTVFYSKKFTQKLWIDPFKHISNGLYEIRESIIVNDSTYYFLDEFGKVYHYDSKSQESRYIFTGYNIKSSYQVGFRKKNDQLFLFLGHRDAVRWTTQTIYAHSIKQNKTDSLNVFDKTLGYNLNVFDLQLRWNDNSKKLIVPASYNDDWGGNQNYFIINADLNKKGLILKNTLSDKSISISYQKVAYCFNDSTFFKTNSSLDGDNPRFYFFGNENLLLKGGSILGSNYFKYSLDKGITWYLLNTPKRYSFEQLGVQDSNIYLFDAAHTLLGYCHKSSVFLQVLNFNYNQFADKLKFALELNKGHSNIDKIFFFVADSTLKNRLNIGFLRLGTSTVEYHVNQIEASVDLSTLPYKIADGAHLNIYAEIHSGKDKMVTQLGQVTYNAFFLKAYLRYIYLISGILIFYLALYIISIRWPLALLIFYNSKMYPLLDEIPGFFGNVVKKMNKFLFFRLFVGTDRALSAWTWKYKDGFIRTFENDKAVIERSKYIQIPLSEKLLSGELLQTIKEPEINYFYGLLYRTDRKKNIIQIIGNGGSGKTSLACAICKLLSNAALLSETGHIKTNFILPLFVDEETADVPSLIRKKIGECVGDLNEDFLNSLLKSKKFLVVIDALSEKSDEMKNHLTDIIRFDDKFSNVLITSRKEFDFSVNSSLLLFPEPLTSDNVMAFTRDLLKLNGIVQFNTLNSQAQLALKLSRIVKFRALEMQITPLLIKLAVEKIIGLFENFTLDSTLSNEDNIVNKIEKLPASIPELYTDYVRSVNKPYDGLCIPDLDLLDIIKTISFLCLSDNFTPKETEIDVIKKALRTSFPRYSLDEILTILDKNGIVKISKPSNNTLLISFILDPLCENFAAFYFAELCGRDYFKWDELYSSLLVKREQSKGFAQALLLIHINYCIQKDWVKPESMGNFSALEGLMVELVN